MWKPLIGVALAVGVMLGVQAFHETYSQLHEAKAELARLQEGQAAEPATPDLYPFELPQPGGDSIRLADYVGKEAVLLYVYTDAARDEATERALADLKAQYSERLSVVAVRSGDVPAGSPPEGVAGLGTMADDPGANLTFTYGIDTPGVVLLKGRPVLECALTARGAAEILQPTVDGIMQRDDIAPLPGDGHGGGCGMSTAGCATGSGGSCAVGGP